MALGSAYRRSGADPPFGDPLRAHGVEMEGYYWRFTDARAGTVVVALCGVSRAPDGVWAAIALAAHPGDVVRRRVERVAEADGSRLSVRAGTAFAADAGRVSVALGDDARLEARLGGGGRWPRRAFGGIGPAHAIPGLRQYWHPWLLGGRAEGHARVGPVELDLAAAQVYAEKNWGAGFPARWWWGQAFGFAHDDLCLAFAGGSIGPARLGASASAIVVRAGSTLLRLSPPGAVVTAEAARGAWRLRGRGPLHAVEVEGSAVGGEGCLLPVPVPAERRTDERAHQHLAGAVSLSVRRGRRLLFRGDSMLAGLELGL